MKKLPLISSYFTQFLLYNLIFFSFQIAYVFSKGNSFISVIPLPPSLYLELLLTLGSHLILYFLLSTLQSLLFWGLIQQRWSSSALEKGHLWIWILSVCAIILSNGYFFPLSLFSRLLLPGLPLFILTGLMLVSSLTLGLLLLNSLYFVTKKRPALSSILFSVAVCTMIYPILYPGLQQQLSTQNNIILIGIDSLNPKYINAKDTPTLAQFIDQSVLFKETISPLARTYPAWSTILTGLYPLHHHASYNLMPPQKVNSTESMVWALDQRAYHTLFATDDRQFNNLGKEFGFQTIVGPPLGANDLLLGTFNDFPLSNLLVNSKVGYWLFPYNHMNRASHFSYYPQTFNQALKSSLASNNPNRPLFLAVHFTLPHWPYTWAESSAAKFNKDYDVSEQTALYAAAIKGADQQVDSLLQTLKRKNYLKNTMIILFSDHGEALYSKGSRQTSARAYQGKGPSSFAKYIKEKTSTELDMSVGHGSDLLSTDQYHCLLAFKLFKNNQLMSEPQRVSTRVALIDLMPTIQDFLHIALAKPVDGISLLNTIINKAPLPERAFLMESGMLPNQFLSKEKAKELAPLYFTVDSKTGLVHVREDVLQTLDAQKLYGLIEGDWVLALYPEDHHYLHIIQHLPDGRWTDDLDNDFAKDSPGLKMLKELREFYHHLS